MSNDGEKVPEKLQEPIEKIIDDFINYCNKKEYSSAYELLSEDCKENVFEDDEDEFKKYVDNIFNVEKIYSIQSYSHKNDFYIYNVKILNDILASGLTDEEFRFHEEKFAISGDKDNLKLTVGDYMGKEELRSVAEDDYVKIRVTEKTMFYSEEIYNVKITNKTENIMVIADGSEPGEVALQIGNESRNMNNSDLYIVLNPGETKEYKLYFNKYYDEKTVEDGMIFSKIRILRSYSGQRELRQQELDNAIKLYSLKIAI